MVIKKGKRRGESLIKKCNNRRKITQTQDTLPTEATFLEREGKSLFKESSNKRQRSTYIYDHTETTKGVGPDKIIEEVSLILDYLEAEGVAPTSIPVEKAAEAIEGVAPTSILSEKAEAIEGVAPTSIPLKPDICSDSQSKNDMRPLVFNQGKSLSKIKEIIEKEVDSFKSRVAPTSMGPDICSDSQSKNDTRHLIFNQGKSRSKIHVLTKDYLQVAPTLMGPLKPDIWSDSQFKNDTRPLVFNQGKSLSKTHDLTVDSFKSDYLRVAPTLMGPLKPDICSDSQSKNDMTPLVFNQGKSLSKIHDLANGSDVIVRWYRSTREHLARVQGELVTNGYNEDNMSLRPFRGLILSHHCNESLNEFCWCQIEVNTWLQPSPYGHIIFNSSSERNCSSDNIIIYSPVQPLCAIDNRSSCSNRPSVSSPPPSSPPTPTMTTESENTISNTSMTTESEIITSDMVIPGAKLNSQSKDGEHIDKNSKQLLDLFVFLNNTREQIHANEGTEMFRPLNFDKIFKFIKRIWNGDRKRACMWSSKTERDKRIKASRKRRRRRRRRKFKELASCSSTESDYSSEYYDYVSDSTMFYLYGHKI